MSFESPLYLLVLLVVPLALAGYVRFERRRIVSAARFVTPALLPNVVDRDPGWRRHAPAAVLLLAVTAFLVGFAKPHAKVSVKQEEATVVLAIDTSRSMGADDVLPTRLAAAQAAARSFLADLPEKYRVGVVGFASRAHVVAAPTPDRDFVGAAIGSLRLGEGTALGDAIATAITVGRAVPREPKVESGKADLPPTSVLVISDGAQMGGRVPPEEAARRAREAHIPVYAVALGTPDGVVEVPLVGGFVERIRVPPDPEMLRSIAFRTGGRFFEAPGREELAAVYEDLGSRLGKREKDVEITFAFAAGGAVLLLAGGALSALWFRRLP